MSAKQSKRTKQSKQTEQAASVRFGEAIAELEAILQRVEAEEIDIDELAEELKKATALLEICRERIRKAEVEVTQIVQSLEESKVEEPREEGDD